MPPQAQDQSFGAGDERVDTKAPVSPQGPTDFGAGDEKVQPGTGGQLTPEQEAAQAKTDAYLREHDPSRDSYFGTLGTEIAAMPAGLYQAARHPLQTLGAMKEAQLSELEKARDAYKRGDYGQAFGYGAAGLLPVFGPAAAEIGEEIGEGRYKKAAAHATMLGGPEVLRLLKFGPLVRPVARAPELERAITATEQAGVRTSLGQRLGSVRLQKIERNLMNFAGSEREAAEFFLGQQEDLASRMQSLAVNTAPGLQRTAEEAGLAVKNRLAQRVGRLKGAADTLYDDVRAQAAMAKQRLQNGWTTSVNPLTGKVTRKPVMKVFEAPVDIRKIQRGLKPVWDDFQAAFQQPARKAASPAYRAMEQLMHTKDWYMDAMDFDRTMSAIKALARDGKSPLLNTRSQRIAKLMIGEGEARLAETLRQVSPDIQTKLARGRQLVRTYHETADFSAALGEEPGVVYDNLVRHGHGALEDLKTLKKLAPQEVPVVARTYLEGLIRKATEEGGFQRSAGVMADWKNMVPEVKEVLFGSAQAQEIHDFLNAAKALNPAEGSATAGRIAAMLPYAAIGEISGALFAGHPLAAAAGAGGYYVAEHLGPRIMARMLFQPGTPKLLTRAITLPGGSNLWVRSIAALNARALAAQQAVKAEDEEKRKGQPGAPVVPEGGRGGRPAAAAPGGGRGAPTVAAAAAPTVAAAPAPGGSPFAGRGGRAGQPAAAPEAPRAAPAAPATPTPPAGTTWEYWGLKPPPGAAAPAPAAAPGRRAGGFPAEVSRQIAETGRTLGGDRLRELPRIMQLVATQESGGNQAARSDKGAIGIGQLMPDTAKRYGVDPNDPADNIKGMGLYLRDLMTKYGTSSRGLSKVFAAYYGGEKPVDKYGGVPPEKKYPLTVQYVKDMMRRLGHPWPPPGAADDRLYLYRPGR